MKVVGNFARSIPDMKFDIKEVLVSGNRVIVRGEVSGTPSGELFGVPHGGRSFASWPSISRPSATGKWSRPIIWRTGSARWASFAPSSHDDPRAWDEWRAFVRKNGTPEFAAGFIADVSLDTAVMNGSLRGVDLVGAFFAATTKMYDRLEFTHETVAGGRPISNGRVRLSAPTSRGTTIVTRNEDGLIESIRLYHRPFRAVIPVLRRIGEAACRQGRHRDVRLGTPIRQGERHLRTIRT